MAELDRDRILALSYVPAARRAAVAALWTLDATLAAVLTSGREPLISQIKLAWWRDSLAALGGGRAPAEPALQAIAEHVLPLGIAGADLARMQEGWEVLLTPDPLSAAELDLYAAARGGRLFAATAAALGDAGFEGAAGAGEAWALIDLARHSGSAVDAEAAVAAARSRAGSARWPARLRPLGMLAMLAQRDAAPDRPRWEEQGAPRRMARMFRHRLTGF